MPPLSVGLSQHPSATSPLIVADWPLHYIIQNFKRFSPPEISTTQRASFPLGWTPVHSRGHLPQWKFSEIWWRMSGDLRKSVRRRAAMLPVATTTTAAWCSVVVVFQIKTTSPDAYQVTPHRGLIEPGQQTNIVIKYILGTLCVHLYYTCQTPGAPHRRHISVSELTSQNIRPRYNRHFVGITWHNAWSYGRRVIVLFK